MLETIHANHVSPGLETYLIETFQYLHANPELSREEFKTQAFIQKELEKMGIPYKVMGNTGLCAEIHGSRPGKAIILREDMDALPIQEETGLPYASKNKGAMHACGHDAHVTVGLGVASLLNEKRDQFKGTAKIMFQPAEEVQPGGAQAMIADGILENPKVDAAIGLHSNPYLLPGKFELKDGYMLANSDRVYISIIGKGGHAAAPHQAADAIAMTGQFISDVQNIISRQISPLDHAVITFGTINGGTKSNIIAPQVDLAGTVRSIRTDTQDAIKEKMETLLRSITDFWGGTYTYDYRKGHPASWNDPMLTNSVRRSIRKSIGETAVVELDTPYMSGDDFSYLSKAVPSTFVYWGTGYEGRENFPWHHPKFEVNTDGFKYGVAMATQAILDFLND